MKNVTMKRDQNSQQQSSIFHNLPAGPLLNFMRKRTILGNAEFLNPINPT